MTTDEVREALSRLDRPTREFLAKLEPHEAMVLLEIFVVDPQAKLLDLEPPKKSPR
jgi:hypothetical protein